jgi:hypothetical protein
MKSKIIEIQRKAKREIFYLIIEDFVEAKKEIESNYNMGLITFEEYLEQLNANINKNLRELKENKIDQSEFR